MYNVQLALSDLEVLSMHIMTALDHRVSSVYPILLNPSSNS
jgi:hypothetical protein